MRKTLVLVTSLFGIISFSQNGAITLYDVEPSNHSFIVRSQVYVPVGKEGYSAVKEFEVFEIGMSEKSNSYKTKYGGVPLFDGDDLYIHSTATLIKVNQLTGGKIWESSYEHTGKTAQIPPKILSDKYIGVGVNDRVAVFDKITGELKLQVSGKGIAEGYSLSEDRLLIVNNENGINIAYDLNTGKEIWRMNVGYNGGFGSITEGNRVYLPSWEPYLYCVDKDSGKEVWKIDMKNLSNGCGSGFSDPPHIVGDYLYTIHRDKGVFKFDKKTGEEILNLNEFGEVVGDLVPYKNYLLFIDVGNLYVFSPEEDKVIKTIELPINIRSDLEITGDTGLITNYNFGQEPYQKGVMTIDLTQVIK